MSSAPAPPIQGEKRVQLLNKAITILSQRDVSTKDLYRRLMDEGISAEQAKDIITEANRIRGGNLPSKYPTAFPKYVDDKGQGVSIAPEVAREKEKQYQIQQDQQQMKEKVPEYNLTNLAYTDERGQKQSRAFELAPAGTKIEEFGITKENIQQKPTWREAPLFQKPEVAIRSGVSYLDERPIYDVVLKPFSLSPFGLRATEIAKASVGLPSSPGTMKAIGGGTAINIASYYLLPRRLISYAYVGSKTAEGGLTYIKENPLEFGGNVLMAGIDVYGGVKAIQALRMEKQLANPKTSFKAQAYVNEKGIADVDIYSQTKIGSRVYEGLGKQRIKLAEGGSLGYGRGIVKYTEGSEGQIASYMNIGGSQTIGEGSIITSGKSLITKDTAFGKQITDALKATSTGKKGTGVLSESISLDLATKTARVEPKYLLFKKLNVIDTQFNYAPQNLKLTKLSGIVKPAGEAGGAELFTYTGGTPTALRIYGGAGKMSLISKPTVRGLVAVRGAQQPIFDITSGSVKGNMVSKTLQKSVSTQIGAQTSTAKSLFKMAIPKSTIGSRGIAGSFLSSASKGSGQKSVQRIVKSPRIQFNQANIQVPRTNQREKYVTLVKQATQPLQKVKEATVLVSPQATVQMPSQNTQEKLIYNVKLSTSPVQSTKLKQAYASPSLTPYTPPIPPSTGEEFIPPVMPWLPGATGSRPKRKIKVKKITGYTPSYSALVFNIKGKAPKGTETGLRVRPITKGFSWDKIFSFKTKKVKGGRRKRKK